MTDRNLELAIERTRIAYERTLLSWVRTSTSLITFGFSVYKFFQIERPRAETDHRLVGPREFGLLLVSIGLLFLVLATWDHRQNLRQLGTAGAGGRRSLAGALAALIAVLGILALVVMLARQ